MQQIYYTTYLYYVLADYKITFLIGMFNLNYKIKEICFNTYNSVPFRLLQTYFGGDALGCFSG